jgi:hypothetical protein
MANGTSYPTSQYQNLSPQQITQLVQAVTGQAPSQTEVQQFQQNPSLLNQYTAGGNWVPSLGQYGQPSSSGAGVEQGGMNLGNFVSAVQAAGGGGSGSQQPAQQQGPIGGAAAASAAAANPYSAWGTQAINQVMGQNTPMVINPTPGQTPGSSSQFAKSGVTAVGSPQSYDISGVAPPSTGVPSIFSPTSPAGSGAASASQIKTGISDVPAWQTWYGQNVGKSIYVNGQPRTISTGLEANAPSNAITPGQLFSSFSNNQVAWNPTSVAPAPTAATQPPITPTTPANAAQTSTATPFAQAPAAPGVSVPSTQPAGLGAAHASALANAGMALYAHYGGDPSSASPQDIANFHSELQGALAGGQPVKMRYGGLVVAPIGMQTGGEVDDQNPPEARRKGLSVPSTTTQSGAPQPQQGPQYNQPAQSSDAFGGVSQSIQNLINARNAQQAASQGQPIGGTGYSPEAGGYIGISPDTGTSGYVYPTQAAATAGGATGQGAIGMGPNMGQVSGAIGGLASGLSAAAQAYANSIKPWQVQASHIPNPPQNQGPAAQFSQPQAQNSQQQSDPSNQLYMLRMMGMV